MKITPANTTSLTKKRKSEVGAKTREAKRTPLSDEKQLQAWLSRLSTEEWAKFQSLRQSAPTDIYNDGTAAKEAIHFSLKHHLERKSVVSDKEVLATAIKSAIGEATPAQVRQAFDRENTILAATEHLRTFVTTTEALKEEKQLIRHCNEARNKFRPINEKYEPQNPLLYEQQKAAVRHALSSTDGITIITGKAGTGKTTLMREVKDGILAAGKQIFSFAPSSEASRGVQRSEGFDNADTVARLIVDSNRHAELKNQVIWVDEAGMLSNRDMNRILAIANEQSARVILSGDTRQHTSVERGDALRIIQEEAGIKPVSVSKIQRQRNAEYKEAVQLLSAGKVERGFQALDNMGAIQEMADSQERAKAIADEYYKSAYKNDREPAKEVLVIAPTHAEGDFITGQIRETLKEKQVIGQEDRTFAVLTNRQLTEAEKQQPESYNLGDVLVFYQNSKGIKAGKRLEVLNAEETGLATKDAEGLVYTVPLSEAKKFNVFEPETVNVTEGDKIRITANGKCSDGKHLFNGSTFTIEGFDERGDIQLSNGSTLSQNFGHFDLGYVSTSHASQGKTADKVIISQSSATFRASSMEQFYVSVSRGREAVSIYTDDKEHLQEAVSQSSQRMSATELVAKRQEQAQEINRVAAFNQTRENTPQASNHLTPKLNHDGLPPTARTEQEYAR